MMKELNEAEDDFLWLARSGELEELKEHCEANKQEINVNCQDPISGNTALHMACANAHSVVVDFLLNICKVDQNIPNAKGNTPLHYAVTVLEEGPDVEICTLLLQHKECNVLFKNSQGKGSTSLAIQKGNTKLVKILLEHASAAELDDGQEEGEEEVDDEGEEEEKPKPQPKKQEIQTMDSEYQIQGETKFVIREMGIRPTSLEELAEGGGDAIHQTHFTVWAAAIILARWANKELQGGKNLSVVELGAGTGLSGVAVHRLCPVSRMLLTDLKIESHLQYNVDTARQRYAKAARKRKNRPAALPSIDTCALDWTLPDTWPQEWLLQTDVLIGSDLVYDLELVDPLVKACNALLKPNGTFLYVTAVTNRAGMDRFLVALQNTFKLESVQEPTKDMLENPLGEEKRALFELHLSDLVHVDHRMYRFRKL